VQNCLPTLDGEYLLADEDCTEREVAKFSHSDAARFEALNREFDAIADVLRRLVLQPPPNVVEGPGPRAWMETLKTIRIGNSLRSLSMPERPDTMPPRSLPAICAGARNDRRALPEWAAIAYLYANI
jgi:hypothetical protein